jgi:hypothetical protein
VKVNLFSCFFKKRLTVCVPCARAGADPAPEQEKLEARKVIENADESPASDASSAGRHF